MSLMHGANMKTVRLFFDSCLWYVVSHIKGKVETGFSRRRSWGEYLGIRGFNCEEVGENFVMTDFMICTPP